jgi:peptide/nickel transport system permease protein
MSRALARRLGSAALLLLLVPTVTFLLLRLAPGEPGDRFDDPRIPLEQRERLHRLYGFDRPVVEQYGRWLAATVRGDLGYSHLYARPVRSVLARALPPTLLLGFSALVLALAIGLPVGVSSARRAGGAFDRVARIASALLWATPSFWLGILALMLFAYRLHWFPPGGLSDPFADRLGVGRRGLDLAHHLVLPATVLALPLAVEIARLVRQGLLEVRYAGFLLAARARGLPEWRVWWRHGLLNSLGPVLQLLGVAAPLFLSGAVVVEVVFSWPGLGSAATRAVFAQDDALVLGAAMVSALLVVLGTLAADLLHAAIDPRVRSRAGVER